MKIRTGLGMDIHQLTEGRRLIIGGVDIPFEKGFKAHSDGDVLVHALCDALLGAAGLKDIGSFFPDNDPLWKNADSLKSILPKVVEKVKALGYTISNVDSNVMIEKPKLAPHIDGIKKNLSEVLGIPGEDISVKAKRTEECLFMPPHEAALSLVSVLLVKSDK